MQYLSLIIECLITYVFLVFILRILGQKEMSQLTLTDFIVFLLISELMTLSIGNDEINFFHSVISVSVLILVDKLGSYITLKNKDIKKLMEGKPRYIIVNGKLNQDLMRTLRYSIDDLCHHLREQGISSISQVSYAILETDGNLSVIEKGNRMIPDALIQDGEINEDLLRVLNKDKNWLLKYLKKENIKDYKDIFYCTLEGDHLYIIKKK